MKTSDRMRKLAEYLTRHGNKCRPRDPVLSGSLRNMARELFTLSNDVAALEAALAVALGHRGEPVEP